MGCSSGVWWNSHLDWVRFAGSNEQLHNYWNCNARWSMVNGQRCRPHGQPVSGTGEKLRNYVTFLPIYVSACRNLRNQEALHTISHHPMQPSPMKVNLSGGKNFQSYYPSDIFGRPMRLCPCGCQTITLLIQRCTGNVAKYCATFQWCRKQISDHDLDAVCEVKPRTRSFQMWKISCHGEIIE